MDEKKNVLGPEQGKARVSVRTRCHSVFPPSHDFLLFPVNTSIPNVTEVKENMTFGSTLVTNPRGGFLVRKHRVAAAGEPGRRALPLSIESVGHFLILWFFFLFF